MSPQHSMEQLAESAVEQAANHGIVLDYSEASVAAVERLISDLEMVACSVLDDEQADGSDVATQINLTALGAYYGELFVRHAGGVWGEAAGEDGPEPAVIRAELIILPMTMIRGRVFAGTSVRLVGYFEEVKDSMNPPE